MMKKLIVFILTLCTLIMVLVPLQASALSKFPMNYVYEDDKNQSIGDASNRIYIPITYFTKTCYSYINNDIAAFNSPEDLFIDANDNMYIADTGNNRVVEISPTGETISVLTEASGTPFSAPRGVFVTDTGEIYVADSGNNRIVKMNSDAKMLSEFTKPDSDLLGTLTNFSPSKIAVGPTGYIYTLVGKEFMAIDQNNHFKGFVGATVLTFDLSRFITRIFASKTQKSLIARRTPPAYNNFTVDNQGQFVACSGATTNQIRIINSIGENIYKKGFYGEIKDLDDTNNPILPSFTDVATSKDGIISALDKSSGKVYQYDQEGNLLTVFAGLGTNKGYFENASSISTDSKGNLYILDQGRNNIQKFEPTPFITKIHTASALYYEGKYTESLSIWQDIIKINADYPLARKHIGDILYKQHHFKDSIEQYKVADDMVGLSTSFDKYRHQVFRSNFALIILLIAISIFLLVLIITKLRKYADKALIKTYRERG